LKEFDIDTIASLAAPTKVNQAFMEPAK